jgi:hypothetical protein
MPPRFLVDGNHLFGFFMSLARPSGCCFLIELVYLQLFGSKGSDLESREEIFARAANDPNMWWIAMFLCVCVSLSQVRRRLRRTAGAERDLTLKTFMCSSCGMRRFKWLFWLHSNLDLRFLPSNEFFN